MVRRKILGNFFALAWTQIAGRLIRFAYLVAIARFLSQSDVGIYAYGMAAYIAVTGIGLFGQDILLSTRIGRKRQMFGVIAGHSLALVTLTLLLGTIIGLAALADGVFECMCVRVFFDNDDNIISLSSRPVLNGVSQSLRAD